MSAMFGLLCIKILDYELTNGERCNLETSYKHPFIP